MDAIESSISFSIIIFIIVLITGCILNLLRRHYVLQLVGIAFFFTYFFFKVTFLLQKYGELSNIQFYQSFLSVIAGISACLISMVLGFWVFPGIRKRVKG